MKIGENGIILFRILDLDLQTIDKIIFTFQGIGKVQKFYPSQSVSNDHEKFFIGLTQEDTLILAQDMKVKVSVEAQINFKSGAVVKTDNISFLLEKTLYTELVAGNEPSLNVQALELRVEDGTIVIGSTVEVTDEQIRRVLPQNMVTTDNFATVCEDFMDEHPEYKGEKGDPGQSGQDGADGKSAYEIAVENGFDGTEAEFGEDLSHFASEGKDIRDISKIIGIDDLANYTGVSVKDYGAVGDGVTDDSQAFVSALAEHDTLLIPRGTYNLNHVDFTLNKKITLIGEHMTLSTILNSCINAPKGIICKNITFDGGTTRTYQNFVPLNMNDRTVILLCTPTSNDVVVDVRNCKFANADFGTFAYLESGEHGYRIVNDTFDNCEFSNLRNAGISHDINIDSATITNSTFHNIGDRQQVVFPEVYAISLGNLSNRDNNRVIECLISDNTIDTIVSGDDTTFTPHIFARNFIKVQGDNIIITNNYLTNAIGITADSECIYTKGQRVEIAYNTFINTFGGEGVICCKSSRFYKYVGRKSYIHDNKIVDEYGQAFSIYGGTKIENNTINIKKFLKLIQAEGVPTETEGSFEFRNNRVIGGIGAVVLDGHTYEQFNHTHTGNFIYAFSYSAGVKIENNNITLITDDSNVNLPSVGLKLQNMICDVNVKDNVFAFDVDGRFFEISGVPNGTDNLLPLFADSMTVDVIGNNITSDMIKLVGLIGYLNETVPYKVVFNIQDNLIKSVEGITNNYLYNVQVPLNSECVLYYDSKQPANLVSPQKHVYSEQLMNVFTTNADFINAVVGRVEVESNELANIDFGNEVV